MYTFYQNEILIANDPLLTFNEPKLKIILPVYRFGLYE